jgi:hypothetical protein
MKKYMFAIGAVVLAISLSACSSSTPSASSGQAQSSITPAQQFGQAHGSDVRQLINDINTFSNDTQDPNVTEQTVYNDCQNITNDAQTLQSDGPINDPNLEGPWSSALSSLVSGGQACMSGIANQDPSLIQQAANDFTNAVTAINQMNSITGA